MTTQEKLKKEMIGYRGVIHESSASEIKHTKVKLELSRFSENLTEGDACPVCGSTHHPLKMKAHDLTVESTDLSNKLGTKKNNLKELLVHEKSIDNKIFEIQSVSERLKEINQKKESLNTSLQQFKSGYHFKNQYNAEELEQALVASKNEQFELKDLEKKQAELEELLKQDNLNKEKYIEAINKITNELHSKKATYQILISQLAIKEIDKELEATENQLKDKIQSLNGEFQEIIEAYVHTEKQINLLKPEHNKLQGLIEAGEANLQQLFNEIKNLNILLNTDISGSKYSGRAEIEQILASEPDVEKENKRITEFENKLYSINQSLEKLRKESEGKSFNSENFLLQMEELKKQTEIIDILNKKLGSIEKEINEIKLKIEEKANLEAELNKLNLRAENIKTLKNLFKGSGFVNFVSSVYLQNLINVANQRFKSLTRQKLSIELTDTNDFVIRDYLNEGKTRSVKTLSGGQTFQASLSLALALADNIQSVTKSEHNFFFLDEGFGSLDRESLSVVFQSLKSLRSENRIVGVISHVEEMQQEIENYLKIENSPETGSKIIKSWEM